MEGQAALYLGRRMTHAPGPLGPSSRLHSCPQSRSSQPAACLPAQPTEPAGEKQVALGTHYLIGKIQTKGVQSRQPF